MLKCETLDTAACFSFREVAEGARDLPEFDVDWVDLAACSRPSGERSPGGNARGRREQRPVWFVQRKADTPGTRAGWTPACADPR